MTTSVDQKLALDTLTVKRLRALAKKLAVEAGPLKDDLVQALADGRSVPFDDVLAALTADELKDCCDAVGLSQKGTKPALIARLTHGEDPAPRPAERAKQAALPLDTNDDPAPVSMRFPSGTSPTTRSVLAVLGKRRLSEIARDLGVSVTTGAPDAQVDSLLAATQVSFDYLMRSLGRDELRAACRAHRLDDSGRARPLLAARLLEAHGTHGSQPPRPLFRANELSRFAPRPGDIVEARHRQWLAEEVVPPPGEGHATRVRLVCLDDDNQGRVLELLWELELGARVLQPETHGLGTVAKIDPPRFFGAYLHALKWGSVTATDARLFQAPFRAGIKLLEHQLTPLKKALALPRANLFIADDVGLGKTIEAGLVLQELLLRQQVELALIVCPAGVCLQWRDEMQKRFGLQFEIMNRAFLARRRQERGFGVNPWSTHTRFIVSHQLIRRPEYRDPLLQHIGERAKKSLLILDEAHVAAPASAGRYAVDSNITEVIRDLAPKFENRLFLSATPHNGHSNSFSALLEILDPQRFTRAVPVRPAQLEAVMVRRLKEDLRQLGSSEYPVRRIIRVDVPGNGATPPELQLATLLAQYTALMKPKKGRAKLVFINLQKRLLSSVEAFARTLARHAETVLGEAPAAQRTLASYVGSDDDEHGQDDDAIDAEEAAEAEAASRLLEHPDAQARRLLESMTTLGAQQRAAADAKVEALLDWVRRNQCEAAGLGGRKQKGPWTDRRLIIFTEYGDTKRYLLGMLATAIEGTDRASDRVMQLHGGMSDDQREEVQRAFNSPPDDHPVRILVATDAAREGINLQGHCADLFHFDIPWNPARLEQRNGRIDRALQSEPEVRCHYFHYPSRAEDAVLDRLVQKVDTIQRELGSLSSVLMDRMSEVLEGGIDPNTASRLEIAEAMKAHDEAAKRELKYARELAKLRKDREENGAILQESKKVMEFAPELLRDAVDVGLELAGAPPLQPGKEKGSFLVPALPDAWQPTVDTLRPARARDEALWDWRKKPAQPVVFEPPAKMNSAQVHLHLEHPFVQRVLGRFRAQGYSSHDLSRVTIVRTKHDHLVRVIAFGRLSLFGQGATRLHDELISVAARWVDGAGEPLRPFAEEADRNAVRLLEQVLTEAPTLDQVSPVVQGKVAAAATGLFGELWPRVREEADARCKDAIDALKRRGREERDALEAILTEQHQAIERALAERKTPQLGLFEGWEAREVKQYQLETAYLEKRVSDLAAERASEPARLEDFYRVVRTRLEPVGLVCLWPTTRG